MKHVYEFTNKRKLTKSEFLRWFQKKFLYTIRKFKMAGKGDVIGYEDKRDFRSVALKDLLKMFSERAPVEIVNLSKQQHGKSRVKTTKKALASTSDTETYKMINEIIKGKALRLKQCSPVKGKEIKPLYLFLDKEVELYAKLKGLKYKKAKKSSQKNRVYEFIKELEKKHPELKHSVVKTYLDLFEEEKNN